MDADGLCSHALDTEFIAFPDGFFVEIVEDFHVIRDETQGLEDYVFQVFGSMQFFDSIANVRFEPRLLRGAGATLEDEFKALVPDGFANKFGSFLELRDVTRVVGHRHRDAVGAEKNRGVLAGIFGELC